MIRAVCISDCVSACPPFLYGTLFTPLIECGYFAAEFESKVAPVILEMSEPESMDDFRTEAVVVCLCGILFSLHCFIFLFCTFILASVYKFDLLIDFSFVFSQLIIPADDIRLIQCSSSVVYIK